MPSSMIRNSFDISCFDHNELKRLDSAVSDLSVETSNIDFELIQSRDQFDKGYKLNKRGLLQLFNTAVSSVTRERTYSESSQFTSISDTSSTSTSNVKDWIEAVSLPSAMASSGTSSPSSTTESITIPLAQPSSSTSLSSVHTVSNSITRNVILAASPSNSSIHTTATKHYNHYHQFNHHHHPHHLQVQNQLTSSLPMSSTDHSINNGNINDPKVREANYQKCFPIYRKQYQHSTQSRGFLLSTSSKKKKKVSLATCISPDTTKFAVVGPLKCQIFRLPNDYNDSPIVIFEDERKTEEGDVDNDMWWNYPAIVSMSNSCLAIAGTNGHIRVYEFEANGRIGGKIVYQYHHSHYFINCMAISGQSNTLACGITPRSSNPTAEEQPNPLIAVHAISEQKSNPVTILPPYNDRVNNVAFSTDGSYVTCSTLMESRFMVISVTNPREPRLLMKSSRRADPTENGYEGISCLQFFPGSNRYLAVTSVASSAPPILVDTRITATSSAAPRSPNLASSPLTPSYHPSLVSSSMSVASSVTQPTLLMRVDKVGSNIHRVAVSPRNDGGAAFLDKSGLVYVMHSPGFIASDQRRIAVATEVASARSSFEAASMAFSLSGQVLVVVDRKGDVHIQDYGAGVPNGVGVGRCRVLS